MRKTNSLISDAWSTLSKNRAALISAATMAAMVVLVLLGPMFSPYQIDEINWDKMSAAPSFSDGHIFGTDDLGRDLFVRTMYGGRISLMVGLVATLVSVMIGVTYGAVAGFLGGRIDSLMMRFVDVLYAMPFLLFLILLMVFFGRSIFLIFIAIGAVNWLDIARIVRGQVLTIKNQEYVLAAQAMGVSNIQMFRKHIFPNILGPIAVYATLTIPQVMLLEAFLSFLGLGIQPPMSSWGTLIRYGVESMEEYSWLLIYPGLTFTITLFALNFFGDGLRDALDPKISSD